MDRKGLIFGLLAILGVSLTGAVLTGSLSSQKSRARELEEEVLELRAVVDTLEEKNENLSDQLQDCTEDYQHCASGRMWNQEEFTPIEKPCPKDQK